MNLQTVTSTDIQRNFARILANLDEPIVVMRDSKPEAVVVDYDDYVRMAKMEKEVMDREIFEMLDRIHARSIHIPAEEVEKDVEEALKYVRSRLRH